MAKQQLSPEEQQQIASELQQMSWQAPQEDVNVPTDEENLDVKDEETTPDEEPAAKVAEKPIEKVEEKENTAKGVKKILAERNAYKQAFKEAEAKIHELRSQRGQVEEDGLIDHDLKIMEAMTEKKIAENNDREFSTKEMINFYANHPEAKGIQSEIDKMAEDHPSLSLEAIYKLYLAENDVEKLLDDSTKAKIRWENLNVGGNPSKASKPKTAKEMDYKELTKKVEDDVLSGAIRL